MYIDEAWKEHLRHMDELKQSVQMAQYEQKDPLLIYKREAFDMFAAMIADLNRDITTFLYRAYIPIATQQQVKEERPNAKPLTDLSKMHTNKEDEDEKPVRRPMPRPPVRMPNSGFGKQQVPPPPPATDVPEKITVRRDMPKVGRNDNCPCGSGKKYKNCHGRNEN